MMDNFDCIVNSIVERADNSWHQLMVEFSYVGVMSSTQYSLRQHPEAQWENTDFGGTFDIIQELQKVYERSENDWNRVVIVIERDKTYYARFDTIDSNV